MVSLETKQTAQRLARDAVRKGIIARSAICEQCGKPPRRTLHGHHADYSKPLEVIWLCHKCHSHRHYPQNDELVAFSAFIRDVDRQALKIMAARQKITMRALITRIISEYLESKEN